MTDQVTTPAPDPAREAIDAETAATARNCDICRQEFETKQMIVFEGGPTFEMIRLCQRCHALAVSMARPWQELPVWDKIWERVKSRRYVAGVPNPSKPVDPDPHKFHYIQPGPGTPG